MKKTILITLGVLFLSGCAQTSAFLGPAIIGGQSGSIYKASLQYGTSYIIKQSTGKTTSEHALSIIREPIKLRKEEKINKNLTNTLKEHILTARLNNLVQKHIFSTRKKLLGNN